MTSLPLSLYQSCFSSSHSDMLVFIAAQFTGKQAKESLNVKGYIHINMEKKATYRQRFSEVLRAYYKSRVVLLRC